MDFIHDIFLLIKDFIVSFWWFFIPIFLLFVLLDIKSFYKKQKKKSKIKWSLIEITPPREVEKTPKAMEQVFATASEISEGWASFEIVGRAGNTRFFVRVPEGYRNLIESSIYAQYSEAEISLVSEYEGYETQFSHNLPNNVYDIWGTELILAREDGYPIKTYPDFKEGKNEGVVDPIAGITEIMSKLEKSEAIWLQILVKPADNKKWTKKAGELIDEVSGKKKKSKGVFDWLGPWVHAISEFLENLIKGIFEPPEWTEFEKKKDEDKKESLSPGKNKIIEAIENKASKIGFHAAIRFIYIDRKDSFTKSNISGVMGAFRQFNTNNLNSLTENKKVKTKVKGFFKDKKTEKRKRKVFSDYLIRDFPEKTSILNIEELATLYHFPATDVKSPFIKRVSVKRGSPPPDLPVQ
jgi:hypothetical protein